MNDADRFWLRRGDQTFGPYAAHDLVRFEADRRVGPDDEVRRDGDESWRRWCELRPELNIVAPPTRLAPPTTRAGIAPAPASTVERNRPLEFLVPVHRNVWAIIAPYAGLVGMFTGVVAPVGIVLGIVAWRTTKPGMPGRGRAVTAIVLSTIGLVPLALIAIALLR
ncbi:MAG: hypothetical protein U0572_00485 [Phycisphaerales bacterium]